jgi:hypothetical protein
MSDETPRDETLRTETPEQPGSGRHPVNVGHLVMGIAFLGLTVVWALFESGTVRGEDLRWFLPVPWLAAGLAGLLAVAVSQRRGHLQR